MNNNHFEEAQRLRAQISRLKELADMVRIGRGDDPRDGMNLYAASLTEEEVWEVSQFMVARYYERATALEEKFKAL